MSNAHNSTSPLPLPLFRSEVMMASQSALGAIRLSQPISSTVVTLTALGLVIALIVFVAIGSITRKAQITGVTVPCGGSVSIAAPNAGIVVRSLIIEGQNVAKGSPLFEISTARQGEQGEISELIAQQLFARKQSLETERRSRITAFSEKYQALSEKNSALALQVAQLESEITLAERRNELAQGSLKKYQTLQINGYVSALQVQQKQEESIDSSAKISSLARAKLEIQANIIATSSEQKALSNTLRSEQAQLDGALASLQQEIAENSNRKAIMIVAPQAGNVSAITLQQGQAVVSGQVLATLTPDSPKRAELEAHLYAPSHTIGFVEEGQRVLIRFQAFPYEKFGLQHGTITEVSKTPFAPNELPSNLASTILTNAQKNGRGFGTGEAMYRVKVKLDHQDISLYGKLTPFKPGMTLDADVIQDRRPIWEWLIEPWLAVAQRQ